MQEERISEMNRRMGMAAGDMRYSGMNMNGQNRGPMLVRNGNVIHNSSAAHNKTPVTANEPREQPRPAVGGHTSGGIASGGIASVLGNIKLDEEKIVILLLIAILAGNGADLPLLAALGYLLL